MNLTFANYTNPGDYNISSYGELFQYVNSQVGHMFGFGVTIAVLVFAFIMLRYGNLQTKEVAASSLFITTIIAILLRSLDMISDSIIGIYIVLTTVCIIWLFVD